LRVAQHITANIAAITRHTGLSLRPLATAAEAFVAKRTTFCGASSPLAVLNIVARPFCRQLAPWASGRVMLGMMRLGWATPSILIPTIIRLTRFKTTSGQASLACGGCHGSERRGGIVCQHKSNAGPHATHRNAPGIRALGPGKDALAHAFKRLIGWGEAKSSPARLAGRPAGCVR
jgi:hypothetical protein